MTAALRHSCRYRRTKLSRCVVCEQSFRRKNERQRTCVDVRCKAELRRFPLAYSWPEKHGTANHPSDVGWPLETFDFSGSKQPLRPAGPTDDAAALPIHELRLAGSRTR